MPLFKLSAMDDALRTLASDYFNLFANGAVFSDVTFSVEGRQVHAHRCILAARSNFFRMIFCNQESMAELGAGHSLGTRQIIPIGMVRYDVFVVLLQFLYSGQLVTVPQQGMWTKCLERGCRHSHCSFVFNLALDTLEAASIFGVDQLSVMIQEYLASIVDKISIDDVMRVLTAAKNHELVSLWDVCSKLVAKSGLTSDNLRKHLPSDVATKIENIRLQARYGARFFDDSESDLHEQRIRRMRQALDSSDVELVRLMVMGEGLDLDKAQALHYAVTHCNRDVVKALLELGALDVNHQINGGVTALHLVSKTGSLDMISLLLDFHASPHVRAEDGTTPLDVLLRACGNSGLETRGSPLSSAANSKLRRCVELMQSAVYVSGSKEADEGRGSKMVGLAGANSDCYSTPMVHSIGTISPELQLDWANAEGHRSFLHESPDFGVAAITHNPSDGFVASGPFCVKAIPLLSREG